MAFRLKASLGTLIWSASFAKVASQGATLADIDHVILFMQENRAFDHYFGTMPGVKGFSDPNAQIANGKAIWEQQYEPAQGTTGYLMPWHINYLGGDWLSATQCMLSGSNGWQANHDALNGDLNNQWASANAPVSWGFYKKSDIPIQWAIADEWLVGDMYMESVIGLTCPNRVTWVSGTISGNGNLYTDNNMSPGCTRAGLNCYPITWKTAAESWEESGISWQVFQDRDNFDDNALAYFDQFQRAKSGSALSQKGMVFLGLEDFYERARNGTLPAISYIVGPMELSEHPPYSPQDGAWLQKQVVDAVTSSPKYNQTALFISYDETGGFGDHVVPYHSPKGTEVEWVPNPYTDAAELTYTGPGFRLPFYIVSPYTRGGAVFTEPSDHVSQLLFVEKWLEAKGTPVRTTMIPPWGRDHMSDLTAAFDFENPDYNIPNLPEATVPHRNQEGEWDGSVYCESQHKDTMPPVPYKEAARKLSEPGFKSVRGRLNEGRYLTFESDGFALASIQGDGSLVATVGNEGHAEKSQQWVLHQPDAGLDWLIISSAADGRWIGENLLLVDDEDGARNVTIVYSGSGNYAISVDGHYIGLDGNTVSIGNGSAFRIFSVT